MKKLILLLAITIIACSTIKVTTRGQILTQGHSKDDVFDKVLVSVMAADMNPTATDRVTGLISATKPGGLLTGSNRDLRINLFVKAQEEDKVVVDINVTLGGQMIAYGTTKGLVKELCKQMAIRIPDATFTIDGSTYKP